MSDQHDPMEDPASFWDEADRAYEQRRDEQIVLSCSICVARRALAGRRVCRHCSDVIQGVKP